MRLFKYGYSTNILLAANIIIGWIFWGNLFYMPLYFQNVRGFSPARAGSYILPMVIAHGVTSGLTGVLVAVFGRYMSIIRTGVGLWAVAACIKSVFYSQTSPISMIFIIGIFEGFGVGCCLQPGMFSFHFTFNMGLLARPLLT